MKPTVLLLISIFAISAIFITPAFSQHIVGYTSLGAVQTSGGNQISEAPNPVTNKIYVSNTTAPGTVMVVSGTTHTVTATIAVGSGSPLIRVNSTTNTIYALNGDQTISVIDGSVDQVIATIPPVTSDGCIVQMGVDEGANKLVVLDNCSKAAYVLDGSSYALLSTISVPVIYMLDAKVNPSTHLLYVCDDIDHLYIVADLTAATSTTVNLSTFWPQSIAIDPTLNRIYMADAVLTAVYVFDGATNTLLTTIKPSTDVFNVNVNTKNHVIAVNDGGRTISFFHGFGYSPDGSVSFSYPQETLWFSANSANNLYYIGLLPLNSLAYIQGPTS